MHSNRMHSNSAVVVHLLLLLVISSLEASPVANKSCVIENFTWAPENMLKIHFNQPNMAACGLKCSELEECSGYTWHAPSPNVYYSYACTLFAAEDVYVPCINCYSLSLRDYVVEGVCRATKERNLLGIDFAATSQDCATLCLAQECRYWSWMGPPDFLHTQHMCIRYSSCPVVETCSSGQVCMTGHRHAAAAQNTSTSPEPCYRPAPQADNCVLLLVSEKDIVEDCVDPETKRHSLNPLGSLLPYNADRLAIVKDVVWSEDCFYDDLCWTYNLRARTMNRPSLQGNFSIKPSHYYSSFLAVGESLVLYRTDRDTYEVYNTATETLSNVPVAEKANGRNIKCSLAINSVQFLTLEDTPRSSRLRMLKHSLEGDGSKVVKMPMFSPSQYIRMVACAADSQFVYVLDKNRCTDIQMFNLETETWTKITLQNSDSYATCLGMVSAPGSGVYVYSSLSKYGTHYVLHGGVANETGRDFHRLRFPSKLEEVHAGFTP